MTLIKESAGFIEYWNIFLSEWISNKLCLFIIRIFFLRSESLIDSAHLYCIKWVSFRILLSLNNWQTPTLWNSPCHGEGDYPARRFTQVRQRRELNWASQLQQSGQQISSTVMSRPVAILRAFTVSFEKVLTSCLLLLAHLPGLIDTLLNSC